MANFPNNHSALRHLSILESVSVHLSTSMGVGEDIGHLSNKPKCALSGQVPNLLRVVLADNIGNQYYSKHPHFHFVRCCYCISSSRKNSLGTVLDAISTFWYNHSTRRKENITVIALSIQDLLLDTNQLYSKVVKK